MVESLLTVASSAFFWSLFYFPILFRSIIGITISDFYILLANVEKKLESTNIETEELKIGTGGSRKFSSRTQLLMFLMYMRQYYTLCTIGWIFGTTQSVCYKYIHAALNVLYQHYTPKIFLPNRHIRRKFARLLRKKLIVVVIDGAEQQVSKPSIKEVEQILFSGKKAKHTFTVMIAVSPTGYIYFVSDSYNGSKNDITVSTYEENRVYNLLDTRYEYIAVDLGYKGLRRFYPNVSEPFPDNPASVGELLEHEKAYNSEFKEIRTVVENVIAHIRHWKICKHTYRAHTVDLDRVREEHHKAWTIAAGLVNEFVAPLKPVVDVS